MPNLPRDLPPSAQRVREYLEGTLPGSSVTDAAVDSSHDRLLLLQTTHVMAAFAFSNGDAGKSYDTLYGYFKKYYSERRVQMDTLDLAFVFCVSPDIPDLDRFCSNVETDVYFCRKFVVPLTSPLNEALARLPFLPLAPIHGEALRPPSAQTFLQRCGVPAVLAKFLVVQRERSPEGIVEDCMNGDFGEPRELTPAPNSQVRPDTRVTSPVRLGNIVIKDFRAYRKSQTFDFGTDVTVLYGPNGFGKTSFFDAIDFAVTGDIGRLKSSSEIHFKKTAGHLDSKPEEGAVSLSFSSDNNHQKVTRRVSDRKQALLDGRTVDRKTILSELTGGSIPATDRVENFVNLFRATHLFSQEHQELAKNFRDNCELSEEIVSRLLAFEDYTNAASKASRVREVVHSAIEKANIEIKRLSEELAEDKGELDRLGRTVVANSNTAALDDSIQSLRDRIAALGISTASGELNLETVRGWRGSLEARYAETQARIRRLSSLLNEAAKLPTQRAQAVSMRQQLDEKVQAAAAADAKRVASEEEFRKDEERLAALTAQRAEEEARAALLTWIRSTKPRYSAALLKQEEVANELRLAMSALDEQRDSEIKKVNNLRAVETQAERTARALTAKRAELVTVESLDGSVALWLANRERLGEVRISEQSAMNVLEQLRTEEEGHAAQLVTIVAEQGRLKRHIAEVDRNQSDFRKLLSQLQTHVHDGICPLCGDDHGTAEELLRRIEVRVATDAASSARIELSSVDNRVAQLSEQLAVVKEKRRATQENITQLRSEQITLAEETRNFERAAGEFGVAVDATSEATVQQLKARHQQIEKEAEDWGQQVDAIDRELMRARAEVADIRSSMRATAEEVAQKQVMLAEYETQIKALREDPRLREISIDIPAQQLNDLERRNSAELASINADMATAESVVSQNRTATGALRRESNSLKTDLSALRDRVSNNQKLITEISARLEESNLTPEVTEEMVLALISQNSREQEQLRELRDSASSLEIAIDTATTAAALMRLRNNVANKEKAITAASRVVDRYQPWSRYFDGLARLVSVQQSKAIANFTREYGPRTSVIQRRLRSVYGFDDVEIQSQNSRIRVRVKRQGEELRPTDYFSQSQQQTLLLGLFLTACLSQTWSTLSSVLLDDPVTHFDDLNTYAFLDLLVGLLESESGQRQFVISTCDEKLLELARQKFRHLGQRAKYYEFSAIGPGGPVVREIGAAMITE